MTQKQDWLYNLKIHYIWTFFSSVLFLAPIITLFYSHYWLSVNGIVLLIAVETLMWTILEIPTSTIWDSIWRVRVLKYSVLASFITILIYFLFPSVFMFYIAVFFSALWRSLWSWTGQAKLQEDLEVAGMQKDFWKVIWRLIALQRIGQLVTPIVIFFILKYFSNSYQILAWLDVIFWIIAMFFVFKFREINSNNIVSGKKIKEKFIIQVEILKNSFKHMKNHKWLIALLWVMIFANDLHFIWNILLPTIVANWVKDFLSSFIVWIVTLVGIIGSGINHKISDKFWLVNTLIWIIFINAILHFLSFFFFDTRFILVSLYVMITFIIWIYAPIRNHLLMNFSNINEKATVRSIFLMIVGLFEWWFLFIFSFMQIKFWILVLAIMMIISLIIWFKYLLNSKE